MYFCINRIPAIIFVIITLSRSLKGFARYSDNQDSLEKDNQEYAYNGRQLLTNEEMHRSISSSFVQDRGISSTILNRMTNDENDEGPSIDLPKRRVLFQSQDDDDGKWEDGWTYDRRHLLTGDDESEHDKQRIPGKSLLFLSQEDEQNTSNTMFEDVGDSINRKHQLQQSIALNLSTPTVETPQVIFTNVSDTSVVDVVSDDGKREDGWTYERRHLLQCGDPSETRPVQCSERE
eukprot:TRINITY_DN8410_c1_g1_i13.p1 TRINITY_DN8410_c1_g1~~TRINITY_DN8410_c1_g1_i13.p1  ORF type:complete len:234 (+),score=20.82 TRINITY_DN8410_c1_g1_i13:200-901(+)